MNLCYWDLLTNNVTKYELSQEIFNGFHVLHIPDPKDTDQHYKKIISAIQETVELRVKENSKTLGV